MSLVQNKEELYKIKIIKEKSKLGKVDRIVDKQHVLGKDLFKKETNPDVFMNLKV